MVKKTIKLQIWLVACICMLSFVGTMFVLSNTRLNLENNTVLQTMVKGLEPGTKITVNILPSDANEEDSENDDYNGSMIVNADGEVRIPAFRPNFKFYSITVEDDVNPVTLNVTYNQKTKRLNIQGEGFEKFSEVFISRGQSSRTTKTDWAGLFSDHEIFSPNDFNNADNVKLAFQGFAIDPDMLGESPIKMEVVIGVGGTEDPNHPSNEVNVYAAPDRIHEDSCTQPTVSTDGEDYFYVSTCDEGRMQALTDPPTGPDTVPWYVAAPLMEMGDQLSAVMMQQMQILGSLFDAKDQNDAVRDMRELVAQAHKDYHPSEQMCRFGSYVRSISHAETRSLSEKKAFNQVLSYYYNLPEHTTSSEGHSLDVNNRLTQFKEMYCQPNDNAGALWYLCRSETMVLPPAAASTNPEELARYNKDIDYFNTLEKPLTLNVDYRDTASTYPYHEEDLIALAKNLYWPKTYDLAPLDQYDLGFPENYRLVMAVRNINTKISLAHNSFAHIVGMKSKSLNDTGSTPPGLGDASGGAHLKALLREFGLSDDDIDALMGEDPSYYAQMEILAKKIYQNPTFYTNLYDKPVNIDRINASLEAIQNMHMRDRYESQLRQEMLISQLVEEAISRRADEINSLIPKMTSSAAKTQAGTGY